MQKTQNKIKNVVKLYKETFPEEYKTVCEGIEMSRRLQKDEFGSTQDGSNFVGRILYETPEKLQSLIIKNLDVEELEYFKSKEGARWFANTFREFRVADKI
jgi:hypothetical protein